jgi:membrane protein DedA with SNARE-associated domain
MLALAIAAAALISEDAALLTAAGLWASGRLSLAPAYLGAFGGIAGGDLALYGLGRAAGGRLARWGWMKAGRWQGLAQRYGVGRPRLVALARVLPGLRLGSYTAAGAVGAPLLSFAASVTLSAAAWVGFWFAVAGPLGARLGPLPLAGGLIASGALVYWVARGFVGHEWDLRLAGLQRLRHAEFWPAWLFYAPVAAAYLWLSLRHRGLLLPTITDPGIENGGVINESKDAIFRLMPAHPAVLPWRLHQPGERPLGAAWPLIAKPDRGQRGSGVRLLHDQGELDAYAAAADYAFLTQAYCDAPGEAGVFYVRHPAQAQGRLFSVTRKVFPEVLGDGRRTLAQLILAGPRDRLMARVFFRRHGGHLDRVLAKGERLRLVESGNHSQGCVFLDGRGLAGAGLLASLDGLARAMPGFYLGRFDLRYWDEAELRQGRGYRIIEVNGATSEATHIYDPSLSLAQVYGALFQQWSLVFEIGAENRRRGATPLTPRAFLRTVIDYRRSARRHPVAS